MRPTRSTRAGTRSAPLRSSTPAAYERLVAAFRSDIVDILDYRAILERSVAQLAARNADVGLVERLRASIEANRRATDPSSFRRSDTEFHLALAEAARNTRLLRATLVARAEFLHWRDLLPMHDNVEENALEHERITAAIEARDEVAAVAAMVDHLHGTLDVSLRTVGTGEPERP